MKNSFSKFYEVFFEKGRFQLIQILGLLDMYFDTVVVRVDTFFTFIQIGSGHTVPTEFFLMGKLRVFLSKFFHFFSL